MIVKILLIAILLLFLLICGLTLATFKRGGHIAMVPISGVGLMFSRNRIVMYDEESDTTFTSVKTTVGLIFIFILFEYEEDHPELPSDGETPNPALHGN